VTDISRLYKKEGVDVAAVGFNELSSLKLFIMPPNDFEYLKINVADQRGGNMLF
jgi:hypothetical protein